MVNLRAEEHIEKNEEGEESYWVLIELKGNSFMYHQIRKMIGLISQVMVENKGSGYMDQFFNEEKMGLWLAPAEGLYLDTVNFYGYNQKTNIEVYLEKSQKAQNDCDHFRKTVIYPQIIKSESENQK